MGKLTDWLRNRWSQRDAQFMHEELEFCEKYEAKQDAEIERLRAALRSFVDCAHDPPVEDDKPYRMIVLGRHITAASAALEE